MSSTHLLASALIGAVAGSRSMTPMATLAGAHLAGCETPGRLILLGRPVFAAGALLMGAGELLGDKMKSAPDRTVLLGLMARVMSAGIAGAALAPRGRERAGAGLAIATATPLAWLTLAGRKHAMRRIGQTRSGLIEDALVVSAGVAVVAWAINRRGCALTPSPGTCKPRPCCTTSKPLRATPGPGRSNRPATFWPMC